MPDPDLNDNILDNVVGVTIPVPNDEVRDMPDAVQDQTPQHSQGFGAAENSDDTRQAQHSQSNDTPTDVNMNAVVARVQAGTLARMGENFEAGASRRNGLFDHFAALLAAKSNP